ncbi:hypothetical protein SOP94_17235 [Peribacillus frigoritolerans]|uniref:hypothetical protein n=1 Tax=Peribacillus frigoritolerans TaxID=450367 RepID=UPI002B252330|nr:hypothetical protein [Peribacillus frigoritolerans]MEB2630202.1 hypothetical protein [Peribacillus frigoritolerans]
MKVIRCYASAENAVNAQMVIQDLLVAELESLINTNQPQVNKELPNQSKGRESA